MVTPLPSWSVQAVNLPEHADNPVHTDEGGKAAGYDGAVVAGTTVYAYLSRPAAAAWGRAWVEHGTAEVRFLGAVLEADPIEVVASEGVDGWRIEAHPPGAPDAIRAVCAVAVGDGDRREAPSVTGTRLEPVVEVLSDEWASYGLRIGEDLELYEHEHLVHPAVWPALANRLFSVQLVDGPWVHTRSRIRHLGTASPGETVVVEGWVTDRFSTRAGERAVADVRLSVDDRPLAIIEHEALVRLAA